MFLENLMDAYNDLEEDGTVLQIIATRLFVGLIVFGLCAGLFASVIATISFLITHCPDLFIIVPGFLFVYGGWVLYKKTATK